MQLTQHAPVSLPLATRAGRYVTLYRPATGETGLRMRRASRSVHAQTPAPGTWHRLVVKNRHVKPCRSCAVLDEALNLSGVGSSTMLNLVERLRAQSVTHNLAAGFQPTSQTLHPNLIPPCALPPNPATRSQKRQGVCRRAAGVRDRRLRPRTNIRCVSWWTCFTHKHSALLA